MCIFLLKLHSALMAYLVVKKQVYCITQSNIYVYLLFFRTRKLVLEFVYRFLIIIQTILTLC